MPKLTVEDRSPVKFKPKGIKPKHRKIQDRVPIEEVSNKLSCVVVVLQQAMRVIDELRIAVDVVGLDGPGPMIQPGDADNIPF